MSAVKIGQATNADVYLDGGALIGRFKDFQLPEGEYQEIKHETLGQIAVLSLPGRTLKEMKGKMTIDFLDVDLYPRLLNPTKALPLQVHSYVDVFGPDGVDLAASYRVVTSVTCFVRKVGGKAFKLGDAFEGEAEYSATRLIQTVSGKDTPLLEIDVLSQINRINGVNVWATY
ncbi:MAG: phage major tail tube protein [Rhodoblastus sp.]